VIPLNKSREKSRSLVILVSDINEIEIYILTVFKVAEGFPHMYAVENGQTGVI
jgi:hypothetical protein